MEHFADVRPQFGLVSDLQADPRCVIPSGARNRGVADPQVPSMSADAQAPAAVGLFHVEHSPFVPVCLRQVIPTAARNRGLVCVCLTSMRMPSNAPSLLRRDVPRGTLCGPPRSSYRSPISVLSSLPTRNILQPTLSFARFSLARDSWRESSRSQIKRVE